VKKQCIDAAQQAIGRSLTVAEIKGIEDRISKNMRTAARADPAAFQSLSAVQRMQEAGKLAAQQLVHEAQLAKVRTALTIVGGDSLQASRYWRNTCRFKLGGSIKSHQRF